MFSLFATTEVKSSKALKPCVGGVGVAIGGHVGMIPAPINAQAINQARDPGGPAS